MATIPPSELVALLIATSFAAGLNVYATLVTLGLLAHAGLLPLPPALHLVSNWYVIAASGVMFAIEFFADKIPAFDLCGMRCTRSFVSPSQLYLPTARPQPFLRANNWRQRWLAAQSRSPRMEAKRPFALR